MILEYINKSCIELIALNADPKNSLRSHLRAIMALDHSRLGKQILGKQIRSKSGFYVRKKSLLYKFLPTNLGACKPTFYTFLYITSEEKEYDEALFLSYRPRTKCSISQFFKTNCIHSIFRTIKARVDL